MSCTSKSARPRPLRVFCTWLPVLIVLWVFLVLYPNPLKLVVSLRRLASPQVDPAAVESLASTMPSDPAAIEAAVLKALPYSYDWETYSMPWYYPTVKEALAKGKGDCKARAIVLASVLEAKGIEYRIDSSPTHVWTDYPGKAENSLENSGAGLYQVDPETGDRSIHLPRVNLVESVRTFWEGFWPPMPALRKVLLILGPVILVAARLIWPRLNRTSSGETPPALLDGPPSE